MNKERAKKEQAKEEFMKKTEPFYELYDKTLESYRLALGDAEAKAKKILEKTIKSYWEELKKHL